MHATLWARSLKTVLRSLGEALFPPACALCGDAVSAEIVLCAECEVSCLRAETPFFKSIQPILARNEYCENGSHAESNHMAAQLQEKEIGAFTCSKKAEVRLLSGIAAYAPFLYGGAVKDLLCRAKFTNDESAARAVVALLKLSDVKAEITAAFTAQKLDAVTFIPTPISRRMRRGFCLASFVADEIAAILQVPVFDVLGATRTDAPLSKAENAEERRIKVKGRYRVRGEVSKKHILIADDILTTGATLHEAAQVLLAKNASISVFALAQTEREFSF